MKQDRFKFRFFIEHNDFYPEREGEMLYEDFFVESNGEVSFGGADDDYSEGVLMQSTGLKDKNGKEIYENCIINNNFLVVFKNYHFILINILNNDIVDFYEYTEKNRIEITDEYKQI